MSALLAPLLAQLVTIGVADRTEARTIAPYTYRYDATTRPSVRLQLKWKHWETSIGYGAALTLAPLESKPRDLLLYHTIQATASYTLRRTTMALYSTASFGEINFLTMALGTAAPPATQTNTTPPDTTKGETPKPDPSKPANPTTPSMNPPVVPGGPQQTNAATGPVDYGTWTTGLLVAHQVTKPFRLTATTSYSMAGGLTDEARINYPVLRGTTAGLAGTYVYLWTARDTVSTTVSLQQAWASTGTQVTSLLGTEAYNHRFSKHTVGTVSAGVSMTRAPFPNSFTAWSIYPTFSSFLTHDTRLARGVLSLVAGAFSAPFLDPLRATVDPRIGVSGGATWAKDRFSARLSGVAAISVADSGNTAGAFNNNTASAGAAYRLSKYVQVDAGGSLAKQSFQERTTIPLTYAAFVGLTVGVVSPIMRFR